MNVSEICRAVVSLHEVCDGVSAEGVIALLEHRIESLNKRIGALKSAEAVVCPHCEAGFIIFHDGVDEQTGQAWAKRPTDVAQHRRHRPSKIELATT